MSNEDARPAAMTQMAPYPFALADLVSRARFRPGYELWLENTDRGQGSKGLTLVIRTNEMDTYHPERPRPVHHYFIVPAAAYNQRSWQRWLFEQCRLVSQHEDAEWFRLAGQSIEPDDACRCGHPATRHDGRSSICTVCPEVDRGHRFHPREPRYHRPYAPLHGPGNDPYLVAELASDEDRRTAFTGTLNPEAP